MRSELSATASVCSSSSAGTGLHSPGASAPRSDLITPAPPPTDSAPDRRSKENSVVDHRSGVTAEALGDTVAVRDVSLTVEEGEIFGIIGPNGAGKTTTVECIAGLRERDGGSITVAGLDPSQDRDQLRQILGMQLQESALAEKLKVSGGMINPEFADLSL